MNLTNAITSKRPFVVAGPCSAETESQLYTICEQLVASNSVNLFRAGIWKPRTRPDSFEGLGAIALPWLANVGKHFNIPVATEVANASHVDLALNAGINVLWIGARTTVNPFAVQEIADALKGVSIPIMIKNPVNPDVELWLGAFERFNNAGLTDLIAIHRGFSIYKHEKYRNVPNWELPIALKEKLPNIPLICDPSHITGNRNLLYEVSQKAMDLNYEGLMIETHNDPDNAWSDSAQQIVPNQLVVLLSQLKLRSKNITINNLGELERLRLLTSNLDDRIFQLLQERMLISEEVGKFKQTNNITILQQEHWEQIISKRLKSSDNLGLSQKFIRQIMDAIHQESIRHQEKVMNK